MDLGGKMAQGPVEQENVLRRGPLLGPVHGRGAVRAGEGVVNVRGGHVPNVPNGRIEGCGVDSGQVEQARSSRPDVASPFVQQPDPQGLGHPGPRVVGRAPPHADQDARCAAPGRGEDQLSRPPGGGPLGVATPGRDQVQSGGAGHLHHAEPPPGRVHDRVLGLHRITKGRDQIAIDGIAPLLKIAGYFLFERQSVLLEVEKLSFKTSFRRSGSRSLLPQAMKQHDSLAVNRSGLGLSGNGALN